MNVILREDIAGVGRRGDIVTVADGHARNYLLPRGLALVASAGAIQQANSMRRARDLREANDRAAAHTVAEALTAQAGVTLDRKKIVAQPIRTTGSHTALVRLHADVECTIKLSVVAG